MLTASDQNAEFNNILNNAADLISPLTKAISMGGFSLNFNAANTIALTAATNGLSLTGGAFNTPQGSDIASAATLNLDTATGNLVDVTGTVTITAVTLSQGRERTVRFTGILTLTHGASLVLPGAASITTAAGDFAVFRGYASGVVRCVVYVPAAVPVLANPLLIANGGTSSTTAAGARTALGLGTAAVANTGTSGATVPLLDGNNVHSGTLTMSGKSIIDANASIAAHATTMDPWSLGNYVTLTGAAVTFTAIANAPQAGAEVEIYMNAAHVFTDGAVFEVDGDANWTAEAGDRVLLRAKSTTVVTVHPRKKTGVAVISPVSIQTEVATTSGTSITLSSSMPSSVKFFAVAIINTSTNGTSVPIIQLGDSGGVETTGYSGGSSGMNSAGGGAWIPSTVGAICGRNAATDDCNGIIYFTKQDSSDNTWAWSGGFTTKTPGPTEGATSQGRKSLSGVLTTVILTTENGTDAYDAGSASVIILG
mgnify:CR=1 FL=1